VDDDVLVTTICEQLAARTGWSWRPAGPAYATGEVGIFYGPIGDQPDQAVGVTLYYADDPHPVGVHSRRVQLRFRGPRGAPNGADVLASSAFTALHGLARIAGLALVTRAVVARLGADETTRQERADSYQIILDNTEASP
jgi:hypothetical protein